MTARYILFHFNTRRFSFPAKHNTVMNLHREGIVIKPVINSINPFNWIKIGNRLNKEKADIIIVRFWLPLMGPALGTILRKVKGTGTQRSFALPISDNTPWKKRFGDKPFTRYFLKVVTNPITMSEKVLAHLLWLFQKIKPAKRVPICTIDWLHYIQARSKKSTWE